MPVISRKRGEFIFAGDVVIEVLDARAGTARIRVDAPASVPISRGETRRGHNKALDANQGPGVVSSEHQGSR